jgi:hypothetical protein
VYLQLDLSKPLDGLVPASFDDDVAASPSAGDDADASILSSSSPPPALFFRGEPPSSPLLDASLQPALETESVAMPAPRTTMPTAMRTKRVLLTRRRYSATQLR